MIWRLHSIHQHNLENVLAVEVCSTFVETQNFEKNVLLVADYSSGYYVTKAVCKPTAHQLIDFMEEQLIGLFGVPDELITANQTKGFGQCNVWNDDIYACYELLLYWVKSMTFGDIYN